MSNKLMIVEPPSPSLLLPDQANENTLYRIKPYIDWLENKPSEYWLVPNLQEYGEHLQKRMANVSLNAHLSTIRVEYRRLMRNNALRRQLTVDYGIEAVNEWLIQLDNVLHNKAVNFPVTFDQDKETRVHLNSDQIAELLSQPDETTLKGIRDLALIKLLLSTGIREAECANLKERDLRSRYGDLPAIHIVKGKGNKSRKIPVGAMRDYFMPELLNWLDLSGIEGGAVFRGVTKDSKVKKTGLNKRSIEYILSRYPVVHHGVKYVVKPHDIRATYARTAYESGVSVESIMQNMGHKNPQTTLKSYIGDLSASLRDFKINY